MHLIWLSVVLPGMLFVVWAFPDSRRRSIWWLCLAIASLGCVGWVGLDLISYVSGGGKGPFMRALFALIMSTDVPVVALLIGSVINVAISNRFGTRQ